MFLFLSILLLNQEQNIYFHKQNMTKEVSLKFPTPSYLKIKDSHISQTVSNTALGFVYSIQWPTIHINIYPRRFLFTFFGAFWTPFFYLDSLMRSYQAVKQSHHLFHYTYLWISLQLHPFRVIDF